MLTSIFVALAVSILAVEYCFFFFSIDWLGQRLSKLQENINSFIVAKSDEVRQKLVLRLSAGIFLLTLVFFLFLLCLVILVFIYPTSIASTSNYDNTYYSVLTVGGFVYGAIRFKVRTKSSTISQAQKKQRYSALEKLLHWLALDSKLVRKVSFDLERALFLPRQAKSKESRAQDLSEPVYVCGLARSGTTLILEILDQVDEFCSLSYRSMPFVLAPNGWGSLSRFFYKQHREEEREHGDGMMVGFDSPEAFEEVFWTTFSKPVPKSRGLAYSAPGKEALSRFRDYRDLVCKSAAQKDRPLSEYRYLSKNNNNIIRLGSLLKNTPNAKVLLVYRDPFETASSLFRQHQGFLATQEDDAFIRSYMDWLGHHEFGFGHIPFEVAKKNMSGELSPEQLDYWLEYWLALHQYLLGELDDADHSIALLSHNKLRDKPARGLESVFSFLNLSQPTANWSESIKPNVKTDLSKNFDPDLSAKALDTLNRLAQHPLNIINA